MNIRIILYFFCFSFFYHSKCNAVAWLRKKGEFIHIHGFSISDRTGYNLYANNVIFDNIGITGFNYSLYSEYGLTNRITIGTNSIIESYTTKNNGSGIGIRLAEYFVRFGGISTEDRSVVFAIQSLFKQPSIYTDNNGFGGAIYGSYGQYDVEFMFQLLINLQAGQSFLGMKIGYKQLLNIEFGYRQRFGLNFNEARLNLQYMFWLNERNALLLGFYKIMRIYNSTSPYPLDFLQYVSWMINDQNSGEIGWVMFVSQKEAISISIYTDLYGSIFGSGMLNASTIGMKVSLWFI